MGFNSGFKGLKICKYKTVVVVRGERVKERGENNGPIGGHVWSLMMGDVWLFRNVGNKATICVA